MNIVFIGHNFKYEIEAVCKLFFPVQTFTFLCLDDESGIPDGGDSIVLIRKLSDEFADMRVCARISGRTASHMDRLSTDVEDFEHRCELSLCRTLFECLRDITGISPEWGMLTGVRPVKLVTRLIKAGMSEDEIASHMRENLCVSPQKVKLAYDTALNQEEAVKNLPENSFSLYVSIPFCPSRCSYCSFVSQTVASFYKLIPEYTEKLCGEIEHTAQLVNGLGLRLDTVYFGGGTPTSLEAAQLGRIMQTISRCFDVSKLREYTVEAGRPDTVTPEKLKIIKDNGGDRVSVNPQTLRQSVLNAIGRRHTVEQFLSAYELAKAQGFRAINVDLIAGLPTDDFEGFCETLERVIVLNPDNITVHALSIKRAADLMHQNEIELSAVETSRMISHSNTELSHSGYKPYYLYRQKNQLGNQENVGWEKSGTIGIYNVNMMEEIQTVLAVGAGASTKIVAHDGSIERYYNPKYPLEYLRRYEDTVIARKDEAVRRIADVIKAGGLNL